MRIVSAVLIATLLLIMSCEKPIPTDLSKAALIPLPQQITSDQERFCLQNGSVIHVLSEQEEVRELGTYLQQVLEAATGLDLVLEIGGKLGGPSHLFLELLPETSNDKPESYSLSIDDKKVDLRSHEAAGLFRAIQTLRQLVPLEATEDKHWVIPTGTINDEPQYSYRGAMLDVSRHFFAVEDVKRFIDLIALCKINALHLHLADDQGWRIEIKSWPRLATHGGSTQVDGGVGGYYTQKEYQDIVAYAQSRYVTIVPEIDMPGHTNAALASYPELNCNGVSPELYTGTKVGFSTLCTSKEVVYQFIDDVVRELAALTPGPYIHIGGDESHVTALEDYIPFIERVQGIVAKYDKQVIGWDEIAHAQLNEGAVVQYWARSENALRGVAQGAKVLMSPAQKVYLDMQYDSTTALGLHWAAYIELDSAYLWSPETLVPGIAKENILGIESPLWSETITNMDEIEYMVFPRLLAHAELSWSPKETRDWNDFERRWKSYSKQLDLLEVDYYHSPKVE